MNRLDRGEYTSYGSQVRILRRPAVIISLVATMLFGAGNYGFYSYMTEFLQSYTRIETGSISVVLFLFDLNLSIVLNNIHSHARVADLPDHLLTDVGPCGEGFRHGVEISSSSEREIIKGGLLFVLCQQTV